MAKNQPASYHSHDVTPDDHRRANPRFRLRGFAAFPGRGDARFETEPGLGHIFRRSAEADDTHKHWRLEGVYDLRDPQAASPRFVPLVYICKARNAEAANDLHRLVWNQDTVPYVVCLEPKGVRVYSGFQFDASASDDQQRGVLQALTDFEHIGAIVRLFGAIAIDGGAIWKDPRLQIDTKHRVYHRLLDNLNTLDRWLRGSGRLKKTPPTPSSENTFTSAMGGGEHRGRRGGELLRPRGGSGVEAPQRL